MNRPTKTAEMIVPNPSPLSPPKKRNDNIQARMQVVESNAILTEPNFQWPVQEMAFTIPSPGTMSTFGDTSIQTPRAKMAQPMTRNSSCARRVCGSSHHNICIAISINELKTILTPICSNCTIWNRLRNKTICPRINSIFRTNVH